MQLLDHKKVEFNKQQYLGILGPTTPATHGLETKFYRC
jgi:hypothetical protein